ncbi:aldehyde dehydrogenase family protein [Streptomyces sp. PKU-MA01144]|uniref:L-piperidine-6-carboxylate dehydrogenase n=1 Tax=Streptomyces sp. PKU-MA01144 TaxID=2729138 RepID=UPI00147FFC5E|nr:aldehyde dehydrogenase family protein [Streptomyces sp. PKU-MA01144]NNJ08254.1 aldehyde dehydrogenase family protein [Streptomyces sp. PKU-MA01144]
MTAVSSTDHIRTRAEDALARCGVELTAVKGDSLSARTPITGQELFGLRAGTPADVDRAVEAAHAAFLVWRTVPAPVRGALVKQFGELLTEHKESLADLVTVEAGKIRSEALGEVQEMIDICDFAVGLSRQLYGRTMPSERPGHRLMETWHPLGVVGVISAFNFPVAVWAWNTAVALVCGDTVVWKPSELTPLTALACTALLDRAIADTGAPAGLSQVVLGTADSGTRLVDSPLVPLVSATGSTRMGRAVGPRVAARFGRTILELGGNNAAVVTPSADLDLAVNAVVFAAAGTAGQRCTTLRRLIVHADVADAVVERLVAAYQRLPIGDPFRETTLVGPLVNAEAQARMRESLDRAVEEGGILCTGGERQLTAEAPDAGYVRPAIVRMPAQTAVVREETFAPILYVLTYRDLDEAIRLNNEVPQGLSAGIFTGDQGEAERFMAADGADCGIVNVNIGTSGAEIGGAFGGEKETGGGRESGSDAWRSYMRRATNTVNYSGRVALAQGVDFSQ